MKTAAQVLLSIFFAIIFFVVLISSAFKFQLLDYDFWQKTFQKHNVYQNLALVTKNSFEVQIAKDGGNKDDVKVLTDLITKENAKDVVDRNIKNFLSFMNGNSSQINIYIPVDRVPKNLLPKNISGMKTEMSLPDLLTKFNFQDWQKLPWQELSNVGTTVNYLFFGSVFLLVIIFISLILLVKRRSRFIGLGIAFVLSGSFAFFLMNLASTLNIFLSNKLTQESSIAPVILGVVAPPVISEVTSYWKILSITLLIVGLALFFVKKPGYNNPR